MSNNEKWFGRTYEAFGDTDHDFLIKTRGSVKVQAGKQFIEIIKDGKLNVDVTLLQEVASADQITNEGIYYCSGDDSIYIKIGSNLIKVTDGKDSTYVSYITQQEVTPNQRYQAQNNIGLVFKSLQDATDTIIDGFTYIIDEQAFFTVSNGSFQKLQFSVPNPYPEQFVIKRSDTGSDGALKLIGDGKANGINFPASDIYELLGNLYISSTTGKVIINEGEKDILTITPDGITSLVNFKTQGSVISNTFSSVNFTEGESGFKLYYNNTTGKTILEVDQVIERDASSEANRTIRTYSEGTSVSNMEVDVSSSSPVFKVTTSPYMEINPGDFIEIQPYLQIQQQYEGETVTIPYKVPMQFYVQSSMGNVANLKIYPDDSVISYNQSTGKLIYQSELGEVTVQLEPGQDIGSIFIGASLYKVAKLGDPNDSSTWLETYCNDYITNTISLQKNYTEGTVTAGYFTLDSVHILKHSIIGDIASAGVRDDNEPHPDLTQGIFSDQSIFVGTSFRLPIEVKEEDKDNIINFPKYYEDLNTLLCENHKDVTDDDEFNKVIPTIGWVRNNSLKEPLKSINEAGLADTPEEDNSCIAYKGDAWQYVKEASYEDLENCKEEIEEKIEDIKSQVTSSALPIGVIMMWSSSIAPDGWLICDGSSFSQTDYPKLHEILPSNKVPDLRDKFVVGAGHDYNVGDTGGEKEHTLTINEMPSHDHNWFGDDDLVNYVNNWGGSLVSDSGNYDAESVEQDYKSKVYTTSKTGGGQAHNNLPPYYALTFIIKAKEAEIKSAEPENAG